MTKTFIPPSLRIWFIIHGIVDLLFAIPLVSYPKQTLTFLGWTIIDPFATRLVGAALLGMGLVSLVEVKKDIEHYRSLLNFKMTWSFFAIIGVFMSIMEGAPPFGWVVFIIFVVFFGVWTHYLKKLREGIR